MSNPWSIPNCWKHLILVCRYHRRPPCSEISIDHISGDECELLSNVLVYIRKGDRSKLSLTLIDRHYHILSCRIPMKVLQPHLPHTLQLCTAWFGREYSNTLESYIRSLESFTFMEYAVWMGKAYVSVKPGTK